MEIKKQISKSISLGKKLLDSSDITEKMSESITLMVDAYRNGKKVMFCGNGGSAADAQHLAAELSGRFYLERPPLNAEALHVNTSFITATANDHSFEDIFERMLRAIGQKGDILVALSTSGMSPNIIKVVEAANEQGIHTIGLTGKNGNKLNGNCDILIKVPSEDTARIQEMHMLLGHIICENVESILFSGK